MILFGRTTYELMVPYWPDVAREQTKDASPVEFAYVFDSLDIVVLSKILKGRPNSKTRIVPANVAGEVQALKRQPGKDIGFGSIASQLAAHDLIDEYHFVVQPIVAGKGPRLFETVMPHSSLRLDPVGSKFFQSGAVAHQYVRGR